jgi:hypothetical protein
MTGDWQILRTGRDRVLYLITFPLCWILIGPLLVDSRNQRPKLTRERISVTPARSTSNALLLLSPFLASTLFCQDLEEAAEEHQRDRRTQGSGQ